MRKKMIKKRRDFKSERKAMEFATKQAIAWKKLMIGDDPLQENCGEPWDEWNTVILPQKIKEREEKLHKKLHKVIEKYDVDGDGQLNMLDMMCDYNCQKV